MKLVRKIVWKDSKPLIYFLLGTLALIGLDLLSKWLVERFVPLTTSGAGIELIPNFLYITKSYNVAIAFSMGSNLPMGLGRGINIAISLVMSVLILWYWLLHDNQYHNKERACAMLLASGAIGNLIDRAFYWEAITGFDGVIDFIQFYLGGGPAASQNFFNPFATFNFADAYLTIGIVYLVVLMIVDSVRSAKKGHSFSGDPRLEKEEDNANEERND